MALSNQTSTVDADLRADVAELKAIVQQLAGAMGGVKVNASEVVADGGEPSFEKVVANVEKVDGRESWADEMESTGFSDTSDGSLTMPERKEYSSAVREVIFGGPVSESFFSQYVRTPEVKALDRWLRSHGIKVSKRWLEELALARCSLASVPMAFVKGKDRLRSLAKVGDNVMLLILTDQMYADGKSVGEIQAACGRYLSRNSLTGVGIGSGLSRFILYTAGVHPETASTTGEAVEAVAGVVYHSQGIEGVKKYMRLMQLLV